MVHAPARGEFNKAPVLPMVVVTANVTAPSMGGLLTEGPAIPRWLVIPPNPWVVLAVGLIYPGNMATCQEVSCMPTLVFNRPPGFWPADKGAEEWGRRHGVDPAKARKKFHDIKQSDTTNKGGKREWWLIRRPARLEIRAVKSMVNFLNNFPNKDLLS